MKSSRPLIRHQHALCFTLFLWFMTTAFSIADNALTNGDFQKWENAQPFAWKTGHGKYAPDDAMRMGLLPSLRLTAEKSGDKTLPTSVSQDVRLQPNTKYVFRSLMAKDGEGTISVRVAPIADGQTVKDASAALNWQNGWGRSFPWHPVSLEFVTSSHPMYRLTITHHGKAGESMWLEDVSLIASGVQAEEKVALFSQSIMEPFDPAASPESSQAITALNLAGNRGEFEAVFLGMKANLADMDGVQLRLRGDLADEQGRTLPKANVVIRARNTDALLPLSSPRALKRGESAGWWITVQIPDAAAPSIYRGTLEVTTSEGLLTSLPLLVRVETYQLPMPEIPMFVYHNERYFPSGYLTPELREAYYRDMKAHGMNTVTVYNTPDVDGTTVDFDRDYTWKLTDEEIKKLNDNNLAIDRDEVERRFQFGLNRVIPLIRKSGLADSKQPIPWLVHKQGLYGWGDMPSPALKESVEKWRSNDWPGPLLYVNDEPDGHPDRITAARQTLDRIKALDLQIPTVTANVAIEELGSDYDVWIQLERRITPEMAKAAEEHDAALWVYNCNTPTSNAQLTRALFGFWAYRAGVKGIGLWAYYDAKNWLQDSEGVIHGKNTYLSFLETGLSRICPSPEGPIPTVSWETTREGVNDYRHAMLFDSLLQKCEERLKILEKEGESEKAKNLKSLVQTARHIREKLINSIPFDAMAPFGAIPYGEARDVVPILGLGNPHTVSEWKQKSIRAYIRRLDAALADLIPSHGNASSPAAEAL